MPSQKIDSTSLTQCLRCLRSVAVQATVLSCWQHEGNTKLTNSVQINSYTVALHFYPHHTAKLGADNESALKFGLTLNSCIDWTRQHRL